MFAALALALSPLAAAPTQADVDLVIRGRVELLRAGLSAPFNLGGFGTPIVLRLRLDTTVAPTPASGGGLLYRCDLAASSLEYQGISMPLDVTGPNPALEVQAGAADRIEFEGLLPVPTQANATVEIEWRDPNGASLASDDVLLMESPLLVDMAHVRTFLLSDAQGSFLIANLVRMRLDGNVGEAYCSAEPNSTGLPASIAVEGSNRIAANELELVATDVPSGSIGLFLTGTQRADVPFPGGSSGRLCVGGNLGRFRGPGQVQAANTAGQLRLLVDLASLPGAAGSVAVQPGETRTFSAWFRDSGPSGAATSNFAAGVEVSFL